MLSIESERIRIALYCGNKYTIFRTVQRAFEKLQRMGAVRHFLFEPLFLLVELIPSRGNKI